MCFVFTGIKTSISAELLLNPEKKWCGFDVKTKGYLDSYYLKLRKLTIHWTHIFHHFLSELQPSPLLLLESVFWLLCSSRCLLPFPQISNIQYDSRGLAYLHQHSCPSWCKKVYIHTSVYFAKNDLSEKAKQLNWLWLQHSFER
mgnify:CR=1 FL=1